MPALPKPEDREKWFYRASGAYYGKQNYRCRQCNRQAVERKPSAMLEQKVVLKRLLLERVSLRAIARILHVSVTWVVQHAKQCWQSVGDRLPTGKLEHPEIALYCLEADEVWTFVGAKDCPEWVWLAIERRSRLVVGFHIGDRGQEGALGLWLSIHEKLRQKALVFTDDWDAYATIFDKG